jgi:RNA 2',3'-cyclic 3'-phosphodiesterase
VVVGRLFIAVPLPEETRHALASLLSDTRLPGKVVRPQNWHLTLRFLGDTDEVSYERLLAAFEEADFGSPFRVRLGALGAFPSPARATVLWVGFAEGAEGLERLAVATEEATGIAGLGHEDRPFRPHLTLSRIRPHQDVRAVIDRAPLREIAWTVREVDIIRSHLGRGGPTYERMERTILGVEHTFD